MPNGITACPQCFRNWDGSNFCRYCGFDVNTYSSPSGALPLFSKLNNRYMIGRVIGKGGFGITYIAMDTAKNHRGERYAIKEFFPKEYAERSDGARTVAPKNNDLARAVYRHGREKYVEEANNLMRFDNVETIVSIYDCFQQNNTAYIVMELLEGKTMQQLLRDKKTLELQTVLDCFMSIGTTLKEMHKKHILHRDLKPNNIFFTNDGQYKLIDFGAARDYMEAQRQGEGMSVLVSTDYAPPEQYIRTGDQGTWSDVYSLCAACYTMITGIRLGDSRGDKVMRSLEELGYAPKNISDIFRKGLEKDHHLRYQTFDEILDDLAVCRNVKTIIGDPLPPLPPDGGKPPVEPDPEPYPPPSEPSGPAEEPKPGGEIDIPVVPERKKSWWEKRKERKNNRKTNILIVGPLAPKVPEGSKTPPPRRETQPKRQPVRPSRHELNVMPPVKKGNELIYSKTPQPPITPQGRSPVRPRSGRPDRVSGLQVRSEVQERIPLSDDGPAKQGILEVEQPVQRTPPRGGVRRQAAPMPMARNGAAMMNAAVEVLTGPDAGASAEFIGSQAIIVGRDLEKCRLVLPNCPKVSREHCRIRFDPARQKFYLLDFSSNGTFLSDNTRLSNGREYELSPGSRFWLANKATELIVTIH